MKQVFVKTQNVKNFIAVMDKLQNRSQGVPGMALVYGEPGLGKTQTAVWWAVHNNAVFIRSTNLMSGRWLLEELVEELGEVPYYRSADLFKQVIRQLSEEPRPIIVDEIDYLITDSKAIETLRDIYDKTNNPIIMMGMGLADKKLMRYRHLYDRFSEILKFDAFTQDDVSSIITHMAEVEITEKAKKLIYSETNRFRQIVRLISKAEQIAQSNGLITVDEKILGEILKYDSRKNLESRKRAS